VLQFLHAEELGACSFVHKRIIGAVGGFFSGGPTGAVSGFLTPTRGQPDPRAQNLGLPTPMSVGRTGCSEGFRTDPRTGQCVRTGVVGAVQRVVPGGQTGTMADVFGEAVVGAFGMPALVPAQVGSIDRQDGTVGPILKCPPRMVLGVDNLCYTKGTRGLAAFRKWKPGTRPFLTGGDVKVLRRANTLRSSKASKKLLKELGVGG